MQHPTIVLEPGQLTPEQFLPQVRAALPQSDPGEARNLIQLLNAQATIWYAGAVPEHLLREIREIGDNRLGQN
jgi:hypothetical protein